jgi:hypothetical protein
MGKGLRPARIRIATILWGIFCLMVWVHRPTAQTIVPLLQFNHEWRYDASGLDRGTAWRTNDYDDSAWPIGPGLLYWGETTIYPAPFSTELPFDATRITTYFRTKFQMPAEHLVPGLRILVTNLVDDGCVIYLNGLVAARVRMPAGDVRNDTLAASTAPMEGQFDVVALDLGGLRAGENLLCVEVHQVGANSDVVFGQRISAHVPQLLTITDQPVGVTNVVGDTVMLSIGVSGTPVFYQWMKDSIKVAGATNSIYSVVPSSTNQSGHYHVVATNARVRLVSESVHVLILPDKTGPRLLSAVVQTMGKTNLIDLTFSERMASTVPSSFRVSRIGDGSSVTVSNVQIGAQLIRLTVGGPNWRLFDPYVITVNNLKDVPGNSVAPNTQVAVSWQSFHQVIANEAEWMFHSVAVFDPFIYEEDWTSRTYVPGDWWSRGVGMFYALLAPEITCAGAFNTDTGYQPDPTLFRKAFDWPADRPLAASLKLRYLVDDGAVFYLNGTEIYRYNAAGSPVVAGSRALAVLPTPLCVTNITIAVSNLVHGENVVAVAVLQTSTGSVDAMFGLAVDSVHLVTPSLPTEPAPTLAITVEPDGRAQLSWSGGGYALEQSAELSGSLSYPLGPWIEVTNMANPHLLSPTNPAAFFRLNHK